MFVTKTPTALWGGTEKRKNKNAWQRKKLNFNKIKRLKTQDLQGFSAFSLPRKYSLRASPFFKVALCASLPRAKARRAIFVSVLASKLADTLSLDYQNFQTPQSSAHLILMKNLIKMLEIK